MSKQGSRDLQLARPPVDEERHVVECDEEEPGGGVAVQSATIEDISCANADPAAAAMLVEVAKGRSLPKFGDQIGRDEGQGEADNRARYHEEQGTDYRLEETTERVLFEGPFCLGRYVRVVRVRDGSRFLRQHRTRSLVLSPVPTRPPPDPRKLPQPNMLKWSSCKWRRVN